MKNQNIALIVASIAAAGTIVTLSVLQMEIAYTTSAVLAIWGVYEKYTKSLVEVEKVEKEKEIEAQDLKVVALKKEMEQISDSFYIASPSAFKAHHIATNPKL